MKGRCSNFPEGFLQLDKFSLQPLNFALSDYDGPLLPLNSLRAELAASSCTPISTKPCRAVLIRASTNLPLHCLASDRGRGEAETAPLFLSFLMLCQVQSLNSSHITLVVVELLNRFQNFRGQLGTLTYWVSFPIGCTSEVEFCIRGGPSSQGPRTLGSDPSIPELDECTQICEHSLLVIRIRILCIVTVAAIGLMVEHRGDQFIPFLDAVWLFQGYEQ